MQCHHASNMHLSHGPLSQYLHLPLNWGNLEVIADFKSQWIQPTVCEPASDIGFCVIHTIVFHCSSIYMHCVDTHCGCW